MATAIAFSISLANVVYLASLSSTPVNGCFRLFGSVFQLLTDHTECVCFVDAEFVKYKPCLMKAASSERLVVCAKRVTQAWQHLFRLGNKTDVDIRVEASCRYSLYYY